jgi:hypothetical protein
MKKNRAEIFLPFDSLKGFKEYIQEKEKVIVYRKELCNDALDELEWKIKQIKVGLMIKVIYYNGNQYIEKEGMVSYIHIENKKIKIVDQQINLDDIVEIEIK